MKKVVCFGELLLRLAPAAGGMWTENNDMPVYVGGAELNVATALALWQTPTAYVTAMPQNLIATDLANYIERRNIDASHICYGGERLGTYYLTQGADLKHAAVVYDRKYSSFSALQPGQINWRHIFKDCSWLHFTAITPALNELAVDVLEEALQIATDMQLTISVDLNYRALLWKYGKQPADIMPRLVKYCHVIMGNIWAANTLLGIGLQAALLNDPNQQNHLQHARQTCADIFARYPACTHIANTFRFDVNGGIEYYAALNTKNEMFVSTVLTSPSVVNKVGSGDCFMAALIYGLYNNFDGQKIIDLCANAAFDKLFQKGDATATTIDVLLSKI